jgi:hypothetical protein
MQDIVKELIDKAGLTEEQAVKALQTIKEFVQAKLPPMMSGMVDTFLGTTDSKPEDVLGE